MLNAKLFLYVALACVLSLVCITPASAESDAYRRAMAKAVRAAASRVLPSVVTIEIIGTGGVGPGEVEQDAPTSGVVIDGSGFILGSSIVVRRPSASILVVLPDGTRHAAELVSRDHHRDLVLLKIDTDKQLTPIQLPEKIDLQIGQTTVGVGRYGSDASPMISRGVLSATGRLDGIALQTDARVPPALYGGPLVDLYGNVLGILIPAVAQGGAEDATGWYDSGIAFSIPADVIARKIDRLKQGDDIKKGLIGIVSKSRDPYANGTEIAAVRTRSPAEAAGIKAGDKVLAVDGTPVRRHQEIRQVLGSFDAGETILIKLERDGKEIEVETTLAETIPPLQPQRLGIVVREETTGEGDAEKTEVIVDAVLPESPADGTLETGDVILKVSQATIEDADSLRRQLISAEPEAPLKITLRRGDSESDVEVPTANVAGPIFANVPDAWTEAGEDKWTAEEIKLPDAGNAAAYVAPPPDAEATQLGLLVLLLNPGQGSPQDILKTWPDLAKKAGVVVCAIAPEDNRRWQPKEMELVAKFAAAVIKKAPIDKSAVAVAASGALAGGKAEAADAMAVAVAMSQSRTFFGVAVSPETRPPAMRLRENEPSASLQIMLPIESKDELPAWSAAIERAGYPIVQGGEVEGLSLLRWVRLLQAI